MVGTFVEQSKSLFKMINWRSLPNSFLPKVRLEDIIDGRDCNGVSKSFVLMVEPDDTIAAVKAYIQEEHGIPLKKQQLLNEECGVLKDAETLSFCGVIRKGSTLIL